MDIDASSLSLLLATVQTALGARQDRRDRETGQTVDAHLQRQRLLRRNGLNVGYSIQGGSTHPNGGLLSLSLSLPRPDATEPYIIVGGGLLVTAQSTPTMPTSETVDWPRIAVSEDAPLIVPHPPSSSHPPLVNQRGIQVTMRAVLHQIEAMGASEFVLTGWVEEFDGTVIHSRSTGYRVREDWFEDFGVVEFTS